MAAELEAVLALTESEARIHAERSFAATQLATPGLSVLSPPALAEICSVPPVTNWRRSGTIEFGVPGPTGAETAARFDGSGCMAIDRGGPLKSWAMAATVWLEGGSDDGTIVSVDEPGLAEGPVRALVVRHGRLSVLGWSWRGGVACWPTQKAQFPTGRWVHVAAALDTGGDLFLYVDGVLERVFHSAHVFPGRQPSQRVAVGGPTRFVEETIPGWQGCLQNVALWDGALEKSGVEEAARCALALPAPEPPAPRVAPVPVVAGCGIESHRLNWRPDPTQGLRCLTCEPPRGCVHGDHVEHWRPAGDVWRGDWELECGLCIATAERLAAAAA